VQLVGYLVVGWPPIVQIGNLISIVGIERRKGRVMLVALIIIALLLLLLLGGPGALVAKVFFVGLIIILILARVGVFGLYGGHT
jgi:hypothetical protein